MTRYDARYLYELIQAAEQRGAATEDAIAEVAERLEAHATELWRQLGSYFLRLIEQRYHSVRQRRAAQVDQSSPVTQTGVVDRPARSEPAKSAADIAIEKMDREETDHRTPVSQPMSVTSSRSANVETEEKGDHHDAVTQAGPVAPASSEQTQLAQEGSDQNHAVSQRRTVTPSWAERAERHWNFDALVSFAPNMARVRWGDMCKPHYEQAANWRGRVAETHLEARARALVIASRFKDDKETTEQLWNRSRNDPLLRRDLRRFLGNGK